MLIFDFVMFPPLIQTIRQTLSHDLPGTAAQMKMAPSVRNAGRRTFNYLPRTSAVMILLYFKEDVLYSAYFKRPVYDGPHSGQIAFPGGKSEPSDKSLLDTALRETEEEFGILGEKIMVLGSLTPLFIPVSNLEVTPFVGYLDSLPVFIPNIKEVEYIIEIPLLELFKNKSIKIRNYKTIEIETPMYIFDEEEIWGATAMITSELETILNNNYNRLLTQ